VKVRAWDNKIEWSNPRCVVPLRKE